MRLNFVAADRWTSGRAAACSASAPGARVDGADGRYPGSFPAHFPRVRVGFASFEDSMAVSCAVPWP